MAQLPVIFVDMRDREDHIRTELQNRVFELQTQLKRDGILDPTLQQELDSDLQALYVDGDPRNGPNPAAIDPLFLAVQADFKGTNQPVGDDTFVDAQGQLHSGVLPTQQGKDPATNQYLLLSGDEKALAGAYGILEREAQTSPAVGARFYNALAAARGEYNGNNTLYDKVLRVLI